MKLSAVSNAYEQLSQREKILILVTSTLSASILIFLLFIEPQYQALQKAEREITTHYELGGKLQPQKELLQQLFSLDSQASAEEEVAILATQRDTLQERLNSQNINVVSFNEKTNYLTKILKSASLIKILSLQVNAQPFSDAEQSPNIDDTFILKQNITLKMQSNRTSLMFFLQFLESLPISVFWDKLEYQALTPEQIVLTLRFHLFSAKE